MSKLDYLRVTTLLVLALSIGTNVFAEETVEVKRLTTTVLVENADACATFWTERLGFEQTIAVPAQQPGETGNQFIAVASDRHELMFQSISNAESELPGMFTLEQKATFMLYVEVSDLDAAVERMVGLEPAITRRTTFYGSEEVGYRDPCGTLVILAEFPPPPEEDMTDATNAQ